MLNKIIISVVVFIFSIAVSADEVVVNPDHPGTHTVVKGDTLWDISGRFLKHPWLWPEVWKANPQIADPHLIYPGDVVALTYQDGEPILSISRGQGRHVKLSPKIRSSEHQESIKTIPISAIQPFLKKTLFLDKSMSDWPYVVSSYDQHLIAGTGNKIYIRGITDETKAPLYSIYRQGQPYTDSKKNEHDEDDVLGYEAIYVGDARLEKVGDPSSAVITSIKREVLVGDRLLPQSQDTQVNTDFIPTVPTIEIEGNILSVIDGVSQIGQHQIVVLNVGEEQGIEVGNVLGIYQSGYVVQDRIGPNEPPKTKKQKRLEREANLAKTTSDIGQTATKLGYAVQDGIDYLHETFPTIANQQDKTEPVTLPEEYVGVAMVFRTFSKVSYALIMETYGPVHVSDVVKNL